MSKKVSFFVLAASTGDPGDHVPVYIRHDALSVVTRVPRGEVHEGHAALMLRQGMSEYRTVLPFEDVVEQLRAEGWMGEE